MTTAPPDSCRQITDVLSQSLKQAFDEVCPKRYGARLQVQQIGGPADPETITFGIEGPNATTLQVHINGTHVGGNVYDLTVQVEGGTVRRFTYSEPAASGSSLSIAPYLGKQIVRSVLDEIEQRLGKQLLRDEVEAA